MDINARNLSLDVFRGITICFMIIVNTPGNGDCVFGPLNHARWHGFTPTDLVFPSFLFAVGNAIYFGMKSWQSMNSSAVYSKILKRTAIIFLLGFLMYWFPFVHHTNNGLAFNPFSHTRILGVLQRIALCYGIGAILIYRFSWKTILIIACSLLLVYWGLMAWGGDYNMLTQLGQKIDLAILGENHMYHGEGVAFEPEGILSTLPSIVNVLAGYLTALFMLNGGVDKNKLMRLAILGLGLLLLSWGWNELFPINKKLWTSSFVLQTVGWDLIILSFLTYSIDILNARVGVSFFRTAGRNPLVIYLLSEVLAILLGFLSNSNGQSWSSGIYDAVFSHAGCYVGSFLYAICFMLVCWSLGWWLDKRGVYIKV